MVCLVLAVFSIAQFWWPSVFLIDGLLWRLIWDRSWQCWVLWDVTWSIQQVDWVER